MNKIFIDPGSSGTKVLAHAGFCYGHFVAPGVKAIAELKKEDWDDERWIEYPFGAGVLEFGGKTYRVGFNPKTCLTSKSKAPYAVPKAIAALASLDKGRGDSYDMGVLLPCDEFKSHPEMERRIKEFLPKARFNGKPITAKLKNIKTNPEGSGLIHRPQGVQVAVMVGHTDISLIRFENGRVKGTKSRTFPEVGIGAIALSMQIPGSDIDIAKAISKGKYSELASEGFSEELISKSSDTHKAKFVLEEIAPLFEAYSWSGVDGALIGGGGSDFLRKELEALIPVKVTKSSPGKGLKLFGVNDPRFHDIYGMAYRQLSDVIEAKLSGEEVKIVDCEVA